MKPPAVSNADRRTSELASPKQFVNAPQDAGPAVGVKRYSGGVVAVGGMPDHVHLLVDLSPEVSVDELAEDARAASAELLAAALPARAGFQWQENRKRASYIPEVEKALGRAVEKVGSMLVVVLRKL